MLVSLAFLLGKYDNITKFHNLIKIRNKYFRLFRNRTGHDYSESIDEANYMKDTLIYKLIFMFGQYV